MHRDMGEGIRSNDRRPSLRRTVGEGPRPRGQAAEAQAEETHAKNWWENWSGAGRRESAGRGQQAVARAGAGLGLGHVCLQATREPLQGGEQGRALTLGAV